MKNEKDNRWYEEKENEEKTTKGSDKDEKDSLKKRLDIDLFK
jgi:hypothetical protein